ncbi:MAG: hypothetical protein IKM81_05580 [Fibrobacter sp.]|nr:hypothetical protein [Fibrobacter sp.]
MENDYLHKISIKKISEDTGLSAEEVAKLAGIKTAKNLGKWAQSKPDGARPNYNAFVRLFQAGATVETLFGVDYKPKQTAPAVPSPDFIAAHPDLLEGLQEQLIADLKKRGIFSEDNIRDIVRQEIDRLLPGKTDPKI